MWNWFKSEWFISKWEKASLPGKYLISYVAIPAAVIAVCLVLLAFAVSIPLALLILVASIPPLLVGVYVWSMKAMASDANQQKLEQEQMSLANLHKNDNIPDDNIPWGWLCGATAVMAGALGLGIGILSAKAAAKERRQ